MGWKMGIGFVIGMMAYPINVGPANLTGIVIGGVIGAAIGFIAEIFFPDAG